MNILKATLQARECHEKLITLIERERDQIFAMDAMKPQKVEDIPEHQRDLLIVCLMIVSAELTVRIGSELLETGKREFDANVQ